MSNKFWLVWNPHGRPPQTRHDSKTSAKTEASRLAIANPEQEFVVLESIGHYKTRSPVQWSKHVPESVNAVSMTYSLHEGDNE